MQRALPPLLLLLLAAILLGPGPAREAEAAAAKAEIRGRAEPEEKLAGYGDGAALVGVPRGREHGPVLRACAEQGNRVVIAVPRADLTEPAAAVAWLHGLKVQHLEAAMEDARSGSGDELLSVFRLLRHAMADAGKDLAAVTQKLPSPLAVGVLSAAETSAFRSSAVMLRVPPSLLLSEVGPSFSEWLAMAPGNVAVLCAISAVPGVVTLRAEGNHDSNSFGLPREAASSSSPLRLRSGGTVPLSLVLAGDGDGHGGAAGAAGSGSGSRNKSKGGSRRRELATLRTWCIAKSNANSQNLQDALNWACGPGGADCAPLQSGQSCFSPNTLQAHASYAFNSYYQTHGFASTTCDFGGTATTTNNDPSTAGCPYPASDSSAAVNTPTGNSAIHSARPCFSFIAWLSLLVFSALHLALAGL